MPPKFGKPNVQLPTLPPKDTAPPKPAPQPGEAGFTGSGTWHKEDIKVGHHGINVANEARADATGPLGTREASMHFGSSLQLQNQIDFDDLKEVKLLGKGACGFVKLMKSEKTQDCYACKVISLQGKNDQTIHKMIEAEVKQCFQPSTNIVTLYNAFIRNSQLFLVMEYMDVGNLEELLSVKPKLEERSAAIIAQQLLQALASMHEKEKQSPTTSEKEKEKARRQIHRDIKPANILLNRNGDVKLADFGVASNADTIGVTSFVGTATYMSPERIKGQRYGTSSDIWSVGLVVAQCLKGAYPFKADGGFLRLLTDITSSKEIQISDGCSEMAQDFINKCLQQAPEDRWAAVQLLNHEWLKSNDAYREDFKNWMKEAKVLIEEHAHGAYT